LPLNIVLDYGSAVTASTASTVSPKSVKAWSNITLATYSTVESSDTKTELTKDTDKVVARAANASRISFVTGTDTKSSKVWSPNEHNASGVEETSATETTNGKGFWKNNLAAVYYNYMYGSSETIKQVEYKSNVAALSSSDTSAAKAANTILTLSTAVKDSTDTSKTLYYQDSVTINIWLEGTDGDCFDSIFDDAISVALKFVGVASLAS
jgi:hypothetical protein